MRLPWETKKDLRESLEATYTILGESAVEMIEMTERHHAELVIRESRITELEREGEAARLAMATHHCPVLPQIQAQGPRIRELEMFIAAIASRSEGGRVQVYATDLMHVDQGSMREYQIQDPRSWVIEYVPPRPTRDGVSLT